MHQLAVLVDFKSGGVQRVQSFGMPVEVRAAIFQQHVREVIEPPFGRHFGFELPHRACGGIARIRKHGKSLGFALFVHLLERGQRHQQFSAHFKIRRDTGFPQLFFWNGKRHRAHGAHVERDVLAHTAVAASDSAHQLAVFIDQSQRHAVEFQLTNVVHVAMAAELVHAALPVPQFFFAVGVVERQHGRRVRYFDEPLARLAAYALRWRIRRNQRRMLCLQIFQLAHQLVEFGVADLGIVDNVVQVFVVANLFAQRFDLFFGVFVRGNHRPDYSCGQQEGAGERQPPRFWHCYTRSSSFSA